MEDEKQTVTDIREDTWYITDQVLSAAWVIVAEQFVHREEHPKTSEEFIEDATYYLREHCPLVYSYYFTHAGVEQIPQGSVDVLKAMIKAHRPLFFEGMIDGGVITH